MDHNDLFNAVYRTMCGDCPLERNCHPQPSEPGLNFDALVACLDYDETTILSKRPRVLGQRFFGLEDLLGREVKGRLNASLIDETARALKDEGAPIDLSSADWHALIGIARDGYNVQIWDREVHFL